MNNFSFYMKNRDWKLDHFFSKTSRSFLVAISVFGVVIFSCGKSQICPKSYTLYDFDFCIFRVNKCLLDRMCKAEQISKNSDWVRVLAVKNHRFFKNFLFIHSLLLFAIAKINCVWKWKFLIFNTQSRPFTTVNGRGIFVHSLETVYENVFIFVQRLFFWLAILTAKSLKKSLICIIFQLFELAKLGPVGPSRDCVRFFEPINSAIKSPNLDKFRARAR